MHPLQKNLGKDGGQMLIPHLELHILEFDVNRQTIAVFYMQFTLQLACEETY
jgi:hypothetical protein